jgi:hypothetical protein
MTRDARGAVVAESSVDPKKDADSSALETRGQVLDLVAGQVTQGRYAPRRRSLAALPGELRGMALAALLPAALAGLGLVHLNALGPFGAVGGLALWVAVAFTSWWLAFLAVERVHDRLTGRGDVGWAERRAALGEVLPHLKVFLGAYAALYLGAGGVIQAFAGGREGRLFIGLALAVWVGGPAFLLGPWLAARGLARARFGGEDPAWAALRGMFAGALAPLSVVPNFFYEVWTRRRAGLDWFQRVPSHGSLDLLSVGSPVVHAGVLGGVAASMGEPFFLGLPLFLGLGALHVQHEVAVLAETAAGVEARAAGLLDELLGGQE